MDDSHGFIQKVAGGPGATCHFVLESLQGTVSVPVFCFLRAFSPLTGFIFRGAVNPGGYERVDNRLPAAIDDFQVDLDSAGLYGVENRGGQVATQCKTALQDHVVIVKVHRAGGDNPLSRWYHQGRYGFAYLKPVEHFPSVRLQQDSSQNLPADLFTGLAHHLVRRDNNTTVTGD